MHYRNKRRITKLLECQASKDISCTVAPTVGHVCERLGKTEERYVKQVGVIRARARRQGL